MKPTLVLSFGLFTTGQNIAHRLVTTADWVLVGTLVIPMRGVRMTSYDSDSLVRQCELSPRHWLGFDQCVMVMTVAQRTDCGGFKPALELRGYDALFFFQYLYYLVEAYLPLLNIIFKQMECEA